MASFFIKPPGNIIVLLSLTIKTIVMKKMHKIILLTLLLGMTYTAGAQRVVTVYPKYGTVVRTVYKPRVVVHKGSTFHFSDGIWYTAKGGSYIVCAAPRGVVVKRLPRGRRVVRINGRKHYRYKGVVYQKTRRGYMVVHI